MPIPSKETYGYHRILLLCVSLLVILLGILSYNVPPSIDADPCWGFLVMHNMEMGHPFNMLLSPDVTNIARNHYDFLSWWSPGQYLLPYFFKALLHLNIGHTVVTTVIFCNLFGLAGFYLLFKQLGFTRWLAALSIAFIASQMFFLLPFVYFMGGEVVLFAFIGWFLYGCCCIKKLTWPVLALIFAAGLVGFCSKSSFLWMYAAGLACIWLNLSINETAGHPVYKAKSNPAAVTRGLKKAAGVWLKNAVLLAIPFICALAVIYVFYLSKSDNPTSDQGPMLLLPETFGFPLASPVLSGFSVDELTGGLIGEGFAPMFAHNWAILFICTAAFCSLAYLAFIAKLWPNKQYPLIAIVFYAVATVFFGYMYLKQATISYEARHFRVVGILCIPGFIYLCYKTRAGRVAFFLLWTVFIYMGYNGVKERFAENHAASRGVSDLSQPGYDKATMAEIEKLDALHRNNAIFMVMSPDIAIEVQHNRVIPFDEDTPDDVVADLKYAGKAGTIYILLPERYVTNGRGLVLMKSFINYHHFKFKQLSPGYELCYADS